MTIMFIFWSILLKYTEPYKLYPNNVCKLDKAPIVKTFHQGILQAREPTLYNLSFPLDYAFGFKLLRTQDKQAVTQSQKGSLDHKCNTVCEFNNIPLVGIIF